MHRVGVIMGKVFKVFCEVALVLKCALGVVCYSRYCSAGYQSSPSVVQVSHIYAPHKEREEVEGGGEKYRVCGILCDAFDLTTTLASKSSNYSICINN